MKQIFTLIWILLLSGISPSFAQSQQTNALWQDVKTNQGRTNESWRRTLSLDEQLLSSTLVKADIGKETSKMIELPYPDGTSKWFSFSEASIMSPELGAKFPSIHTYKGTSNDGKAVVRFDLTPKGFHAIIFEESQTVYIDPDDHLSRQNYHSYNRNDFKKNRTKSFIEDEWVSADKVAFEPNKMATKIQNRTTSGTMLRKYRIAIAANGEYTTFHGGTVEAGLAAIVTSLNRVTGIYENELAVTFELVADNDQLIYTSASTDPYTDGNELPENQANLNEVIGSANYDIGHVFTTASGGLAGLGVVCGNSKAQGTTGTNNPVGDPFDVDYVSHEIGHQFGGNHTFNGSSGSCAGGNRNGSTAYEPGSGTSIMAYAGICSPQNTQNNSDPYFHVASLEEIITFTTEGGGSGCPTTTETGNTAPEVTILTPSVTIPANTPFQLIGEATDVDGDELTYSWEQYDLGPTGHPDSPEDNAALFRVFSPVDHGVRVFPQTSDLIGSTQTMGELLPSYTRSMNFQMVVRDNNAAGGGINTGDLSLEVDGESGPFIVTSQSESNTSYFAQTIQVVNWNVAGTDGAKVACETVKILLSIDGGETFDIVLVESTANDGSESVTIPSQTTDQARIKVEAIGNAFFNISPMDFSIVVSEIEDFYLHAEANKLSVCEPAEAVYVVNASALNGFSGSIDLTLTENSTLVYEFSSTSIEPGGQVELTIKDTDKLTELENAFAISGTSGDLTHDLQLILEVWPSSLPEVQIISPAEKATDVLKFTEYVWEAVEGAEYYDFDLSTSSDFSSTLISEQQIVATNLSGTEALNSGQEYHWRVRAVNNCGTGAYKAFSFTTLNEVCFDAVASDLPITIEAASTNTISSFVEVEEDFIISDINVLNLDISHTYIGDLIITLIAPSGQEVVLMSEICGENIDVLISFDSESTNSTIPCPPKGGVYQPLNSLTSFNGLITSGTWELKIEDTFDEDGGSLNAWELELCGKQEEIKLSADVVTHDQVDLSWEYANSGDESGFELEYSMDQGATYQSLSSPSAGESSYAHVNLESMTIYNYRIRSVVSGESGEYSRVLMVTTLLAPPASPLDLSGEFDFDVVPQVALSWTEGSDNHDGFIIERKLVSSEDWEELETTAQLSYTDKSVVLGESYSYRVFAYNDGGLSEASNEISTAVVLGLSPDLSGQFSIYPNPSHGLLKVESAGNASFMIKELRITTVSGHTVFSNTALINEGNEGFEIDLSDLSDGLYIVNMTTDTGRFMIKWLKK